MAIVPHLVSGRRIYRSMVIMISHYLSAASVEAALRTVLAKNGLTPATLTAENLATVVAEAMLGFRSICDPERLPDLMVDPAEYAKMPVLITAKATAGFRSQRVSRSAATL